MSISKHKQILGLQVYKCPGIDILSADRNKWEELPEWIINSTGQIVDTNDWKEEPVPDKEYIMVNYCYSDPLLGEEINNAGLDDTMRGVNLLPILDKVSIQEITDYGIGPIARIAVEMSYRCGNGFDDMYDCDLDIRLLGYLNDELQLVLV